MKRGLRIGGHPLHAALSDFPMVLLLLWVALDGTALAVGSPLLWTIGRWALIGGMVAAVLAASAGLMDYLGVGESAPRGLRTATAHLAVMLSVTCVAAVDLVYRGTAPPTGAGRVLHIAALVLVAGGLGAGGWLGGHLVFHHGVGVEGRGLKP
jgi:Predicted membrane protein